MSRSDDGAAFRRAGPPTWILLDNNAFIDDLENASTATAWTSTGLPIRVTLAAAEPPRDSYFCVHCPCLKKRKHGDDEGVFAWVGRPLPPTVVYSNGDLALLCVPLPAGPDRTTDYFIYKAGRHPSLRLLPATFSGAEFVPHATVGLVPVGGDGEHVVLATIGYTKQTHELHIFRSDRGAWTTTPLVLGTRVHLELTKAIALGGGDLGWVDLRRCILVCDVLSDDDPNPRLVPLPKLLPSNLPDKRHRLPREYRDVVVGADGSITCVEIEHCLRRVEARDVSTADVLHDSELPLGMYDDDKPTYKFEYLGWRIIAWNRAVSSTCWRKRGLIHVDDVVANDPGHAALLLPTAGDDGGPGFTLRHVAATQVPSLSIHGGDVAYIMGKANQFDKKTWMFAVDMAKKTLEEVAPISAEESGCPSYISCSLSKYLEN